MRRFDPGWCFVLSGLVLLAAALLVPAWRDVQTIRAQVGALEQQVAFARAREQTGRTLLEALRSDDPAVYQRLVAWQWNLVPLGDEPVIRERHDGGISSWVEARTPIPAPGQDAVGMTALERVLQGPFRPWALALGGLLLLLGIVVLPMGSPASRTAVA
ncbi:MAG: hypothetical protein MK101_04355 [Phycisphaerales bacterium]|nr:hypothetical protein [Phycisphaerales bacterium]